MEDKGSQKHEQPGTDNLKALDDGAKEAGLGISGDEVKKEIDDGSKEAGLAITSE